MTTGLFTLKVASLKCFGAEPQGFDEIKTLNLIIGRNNSGKSSLLDLVHQATLGEQTFSEAHWHKNKVPQIFTETEITHEDIYRSFPSSHSGGPISGNHFEYGKQFIGGKVRVHLAKNNVFIGATGPNELNSYPDLENVSEYTTRLASFPERNPLRGKKFQRLSAERDIVEESDLQNSVLEIQDNGRGITNLIQCFLNKSNLPSDLVEITLLNALNEVFGSDAIFTSIVCQQHPSTLWEIYLGQENKGRIALSQSGSGLKTIIQALCFIHLLPRVTNTNINNFVFAFEELENNLHPALQRRLLTYIAKQARINNFIVFLTTHSNVAIDIFNTQDDAQILHVTHNSEFAQCKTVRAYVEHNGVLDDLDIRASDLLQSNGIIWVEGPSDRIFLNRWIELWSGGALKEGNHYQCVIYGGRLLAHLSGLAPDDEGNDGISILKVNRNAIVLMDSDKRAKNTAVNATKKRVCEEIEDMGGLGWITSGREIENYIVPSVVQKWLPHGVLFKEISSQYENFYDYLDLLQTGLGKRFLSKKPLLAEEVSLVTTREDLETHAQLSQRLAEVCAKIRGWNNLAG